MAKGKDIKAGSAFIEMTVKTDKMKDGMRRAGKESKGLNKAIAFLGKGWVPFAAGAIAAGVAMKKMGDLTAVAAGEMRVLSNLTNSFNLPVEEFEKMSLALSKTGGAAASNAMATAFAKVADSQFQVKTGNEQLINDLAVLGINVEEFGRASVKGGFLILADAVDQFTDATSRAKVSQILLGTANADFVAGLAGGAAALEKNAELMAKYTDPDRAATLEKVSDATTEFSAAWKDLKGEISETLAPSLTTFLKDIASVVSALSSVLDVINKITGALDQFPGGFGAPSLATAFPGGFGAPSSADTSPGGFGAPSSADKSSGGSVATSGGSVDATTGPDAEGAAKGLQDLTKLLEAKDQDEDETKFKKMRFDVSAQSALGGLASQQSLGLAGAGLKPSTEAEKVVMLQEENNRLTKEMLQTMKSQQAFGPQ